MTEEEKREIAAYRAIRDGLNMKAESATPEEVVAEVRKVYALAYRPVPWRKNR